MTHKVDPFHGQHKDDVRKARADLKAIEAAKRRRVVTSDRAQVYFNRVWNNLRALQNLKRLDSYVIVPIAACTRWPYDSL